MAIGTAILLGVGVYLAAALPIAVVIGRLLGGPSAERAASRALARPSGVPSVPAVAALPGFPALTLPVQAPLVQAPLVQPPLAGLVGAHVAASRPVALVARQA